MDPQTPNMSTSTPETPTTMHEVPKKDNHGITIAAMAVFVLLALGAVAFLYYQNQQLKDILAGYQTQPSPAPTATVDPTANWKTFTNTKYQYSFKYPGEYMVVVNGMNSPDIETQPFIIATTLKAQDGDPVFTLSVMPKMNEPLQVRAQKHFDKVSNYILKPAPEFPTYQSNKPIVEIAETNFMGLDAYSYTIFGSYAEDGAVEGISPPLERKYIWVNHEGNDILIRIDGDSITNQILSTLKFIGPTASPSAKPVACTLEAKICPDGSSVGRTGPNCEFAPCP